METRNLFDPIERALHRLEMELDRLRARAQHAEGDLRGELARHAEAALDTAARLSRELTDAWRLQGVRLDRRNREAAAAARRHLEHWIATLRRRAEALRPAPEHTGTPARPETGADAPPPAL